MIESPLPFLKVPTPKTWVESALKDMGAFLSDHAWCERKASGNCLSLLSAHLEHPCLAEPMIRLAREELEHFQLVYRHMELRGLPLAADKADSYVRALRTKIRPTREQLLDRLLVAALIEARSCERLGIVAEALTDPDLKDFYQRLTRAEARHFFEFVELAEKIYPIESVKQRLAELLEFESQVMLEQPHQPTVH